MIRPLESSFIFPQGSTFLFCVCNRPTRFFLAFCQQQHSLDLAVWAPTISGICLMFNELLLLINETLVSCNSWPRWAINWPPVWTLMCMGRCLSNSNQSTTKALRNQLRSVNVSCEKSRTRFSPDIKSYKKLNLQNFMLMTIYTKKHYVEFSIYLKKGKGILSRQTKRQHNKSWKKKMGKYRATKLIK